MEFDPQDQDIVKLLAKLKNAGGEYPEHLLVSRRHMYLKQMAEIGMGVGVNTGVENAAKTTNPPPVPPAASTLLETVLLVAIVAETGAVAYFYRDKLADFFQTFTTDKRVQEVTPPPVPSAALEIEGVTPSPAVTATIPSVVLFASPTDFLVPVTGTPIPGVADEPGNGASPSGAAANPADSTPVPNANGGSNGDIDHQDQGNHYGQTPKPERTIENSGNNDQSSQDNGGPATNNDNQSSDNTNNRPPRNRP